MRWRPALALAVIAATMAACAAPPPPAPLASAPAVGASGVVPSPTGLVYRPPPPPSPAGAWFRVDGMSLNEAGRIAARRLRAANFRNVRYDPVQAIVHGSAGPRAQDCGTVTVRNAAGLSSFPATEPTAVLEVPGQGAPTFVRRRFDGRTDFRVLIGADQGGSGMYAKVEESHAATIAFSTPSGSRPVGQERIAYVSGAAGRFGSGTICVSSGAIAAALR